MTSIEKLTIVVQGMWGKNISWCHHLGAALLVIEKECKPSPALDAVKEQVEKVQSLCREMCVGYDNLRALMGRLEQEQGIKEPRFRCGKIKDSGGPAKCQIGACDRVPRDAKKQDSYGQGVNDD